MYVKLGGGGVNFPDNRDIMTRMKEQPKVKSAMKKLIPFVQLVCSTTSFVCYLQHFAFHSEK